MKQLASWTIRRALQDRQKLDLHRYGNLVVSVNISPNQINEDRFLAQLKGMLDEYQVRPEMLRLELTENTLIEASSRTIAQMTALRKDIPNHEVAVEKLLEQLVALNIISSFDEITGVGHRVVAGGESKIKTEPTKAARPIWPDTSAIRWAGKK